MTMYRQIIDTLRTFAHRTGVERVDEAVQALLITSYYAKRP
jgi:hypothetical protein